MIQRINFAPLTTAIPDEKTTKVRRIVSRETSVPWHHWEPIEGPLGPSQDYRIEGFKWGLGLEASCREMAVSLRATTFLYSGHTGLIKFALLRSAKQICRRFFRNSFLFFVLFFRFFFIYPFESADLFMTCAEANHVPKKIYLFWIYLLGIIYIHKYMQDVSNRYTSFFGYIY